MSFRRHFLASNFKLGALEPDYDSFPDWDEDCHGPIDTAQNRKEYPECFFWDCCDKDTTSEGCEEGKHVPQKKKLRRF